MPIARISVEVIKMAARVPLEDLVKGMSEEMKGQVYDFVNYLIKKRLWEEDLKWNEFSLREAVRGIEEELLYTEADLKERWR